MTGPRVPEAAEEGPTAELLRARRGGELSTLDRLLLHSPPVAEGWNALLGALRGATTLRPTCASWWCCGWRC